VKSLFFQINKKNNKVFPEMDFSELPLEITQILSDSENNKKDTKISRFFDFFKKKVKIPFTEDDEPGEELN
jgi:hypothetical protein